MTNQKILITGTGRAGTTALVAFFTDLGYKTGYDESDVRQAFNRPGRCGLEDKWDSGYQISKRPFCDIKYLKRYDSIIVPVRKIEDVARSRERIEQTGSKYGAFHGAKTYEGQIRQSERYLGMLFAYLILKNVYYLPLKFPQFVYDFNYFYKRMSRFITNFPSEEKVRKSYTRTMNLKWVNKFD